MNIPKGFRKQWLLVICLLLVSLTAFAQEPERVKVSSKQDRARDYHYKALDQFQQGKYKKAVTLLNRAIGLYPDNEFFVDLAGIHESQGELKKSYLAISKLKTDDKDRPILRVLMEAKIALYALNLGFNLEAHERQGAARKWMSLYGIDSLALQSVLENNYGVTKIFHQTAPPQKGYINVHRRDIEAAKRFFETAIKLDSSNCMARYNLDFAETMLSELAWDSIKTLPRYPTAEAFEKIAAFPNLDCPIPQFQYDEEVIKTLTLEKEIILILDISGSMANAAPDGRPRIEVMRELAIQLLSELDERVKIGLLTLGGNCSNKPSHQISIRQNAARSELIGIVENLQLDGCTPLNLRLQQASKLFSDQKRDNKKAIFLLSDGMNYCCENPSLNAESTCEMAKELSGKGIKIHVFSLLADESANGQQFAIYNCMSMLTEGRLFSMEKADESEQRKVSMSSPIYALPLRKEDLISGQYKLPNFQGEQITHEN